MFVKLQQQKISSTLLCGHDVEYQSKLSNMFRHTRRVRCRLVMIHTSHSLYACIQALAWQVEKLVRVRRILLVDRQLQMSYLSDLIHKKKVSTIAVSNKNVSQLRFHPDRRRWAKNYINK